MNERVDACRTLPAPGRWVRIPVYDSAEKAELICQSAEKTLWRMLVPVPGPDSRPRCYGILPAGEEEVTVRGPVPASMLEALSRTDEMPAPADVHPVLHFAARNGWLNDPNGLIYHQGVWQLYFQHNPVDLVWENMTWGHAVSRDLLHWTQVEDALYPDENGTMFSGSAIANTQGMLGLPRDALLFFYTSAGSTSAWSREKPFTQRLAYSTDGGRTLVKSREVVPNLRDGNRDPKVYYYPPKATYYMVLYLAEDDFAILTSSDLRHFTKTQQLSMPGSGECPDLRRVPSEDGEERWMFLQADGQYLIGDFDGEHFTARSHQQRAYGTGMPYAAQTFNQPEDRVIWTAFLHLPCQQRAYTNVMALPRELRLIRHGDDLALQMRPVAEYYAARREVSAPVYDPQGDRALAVEVERGSAETVEIRLGDVRVLYDRRGTLRGDAETVEFAPDASGLHLIVDKGVLEIAPMDEVRPAYFAVAEERQRGPLRVVNAAETERVTYYEIV